MPGKVIGTVLQYGYAGNPSRMSDCVIAPYRYDIAHAADGNIAFGEFVAIDTTNGGIRKLGSSDSDGSAIIGVAVRHIGQPKADNENGWYYAPGEIVDVMLRGSMTVKLKNTTSIVAGGGVYTANGTNSTTVGDIVCAAASGYVQVPNAVIATGKVDATDKLAEITLLERKA